MDRRTSVTGCIAMLGIMSVSTGCAGRVPGQASAIDLRAVAPYAKHLAASGDKRAMSALTAVATASDPRLATDPRAMALVDQKSGDAASPPTAAVAGAATAEAVKLAAPGAVTPAAAEAAAKAVEVPSTEPVVAQHQAAPASADVALVDPTVAAAKADAEPPAPELGFMIPGLSDLAAAIAPTPEVKVLFQDSFEDGLAAWVSRGLGQPDADARSDDDTVVLATSRARRSLWIKTRSEIDLGTSAEPRLRLAFKGESVALKAVWETEHGAFTEEILLAPIEAEDVADDAPLEFDLTALKQRPGHLVLVARAPKGGAAAPILDGVTIFDAAAPLPE